jgi:hypothetical protein
MGSGEGVIFGLNLPPSLFENVVFGPLALLVAAIVSPAVRAGCEEPTPVAELVALVQQAEASVGRDAAVFGDAAEGIERVLPCVQELVGSGLAARIHRVQGLRAFVEGAGQRSVVAFAASRRLEPGYRFPESVFPGAHPVPGLWERAAQMEWAFEPVTVPEGSLLFFDGVVGNERPTSAPTILQQQDAEGLFATTAYLWPGDDLPDLAPATVARRVWGPDEHHIVVPGQRRAHIPLVVSAGLCALAAGGSYALAHNTATDYRNNPHSNAELEQLRGRANTLVYVSGGLGGFALLTGVGAAIAWPR